MKFFLLLSKYLFKVINLYNIFIFIFYNIYTCPYSDHKLQLESENTRNIERRHDEEFAKWFESQVSAKFKLMFYLYSC